MSNIARNFRQLTYRRGNMRNGLYPNAAALLAIIRAQNHAMAYRHREVYRRAWELAAFSGATGTTTISRSRFRTGFGVTTLTYVVMMGVDQFATATNPYLEIDTTISGGATTTRQFHYGLSAVAGIDAPSEIVLMTADVAVTASTVYEVAIKSVDYGRPVSICAYEQATQTVSESTNHYNLHQPSAGSPIYDANRQRVALGASEMYRTMGGITWHWGLDSGAARTRSSATYINIIDNATTGTPATSDYGFYINPQYHQTLSATTVPFELAMYCDPNGGTANVRLCDSAGNTYGPVSKTGAAGWASTAINLPASDTFYTAQYAGDGVLTSSVYQISLIEYS